jgi:hypothetical protein
MNSGIRAFACLGLVALMAGCGRLDSSDPPGTPEDGGGAAIVEVGQDAATDATVTTVTHLSDDGSISEDAWAPPSVDAGICTVADAASFAGRVPVLHRASGSTCPGRAAGNDFGSCAYDAGAVACLQDGDCTAGKLGRCLVAHIPPPPVCSTPYCSYDDCESDTDCPSGVPCDCRPNAIDDGPNVCATGSNCRTDSDCGGRYCSPGQSLDEFCEQQAYFCHTPGDLCIDDSDCCWPTSSCSYDRTQGRFACAAPCVPPP